VLYKGCVGVGTWSGLQKIEVRGADEVDAAVGLPGLLFFFLSLQRRCILAKGGGFIFVPFKLNTTPFMLRYYHLNYNLHYNS
jgi:hypothetical protein